MDYTRKLRPKLETLTMIGIFLEKVPLSSMSASLVNKFESLIAKSVSDIDTLIDKIAQENDGENDSDEIRFD